MRPIFIQEIDFTLTDSLSVSVPQYTSGAFFACLGCEDLPSRFAVDVFMNGARTALPRTGRKVGNYAVVPVPNYTLTAEGTVLLGFGGRELTLTVTSASVPSGYSLQEEDADALHGALEALERHPENLVRGTAFNDPTRYDKTANVTVYQVEGAVELKQPALKLTDYVDLTKGLDAATLEKGQTYTLSYEYKYDVTEKGTTNPLHGGELAVKFADGTTKWYGAKPALSSTGGKWVKWSATFTLESDLGDVQSATLNLYQRDIKGACRYRNVKLSKGTFTGRWSLAPLDTDHPVARYMDANGWKVTKWASGDLDAVLNLYKNVSVTNAYYTNGTYYTNIYHPIPDGAVGYQAVIGDVLSGDMTTGKVVDLENGQITYRIFNTGASLASEDLRLFLHYFGHWK